MVTAAIATSARSAAISARHAEMSMSPSAAETIAAPSSALGGSPIAAAETSPADLTTGRRLGLVAHRGVHGRPDGAVGAGAVDALGL